MANTAIPVDGVVDAHVHLMPDRLMDAIREALGDVAGWDFDDPTDQESMEATLRDHGVDRYVALPYAHKPGIADDLNDWVIEAASDAPMCVPFATVHPEDDVDAVVTTAFERGARGLKFQCPVQEVAPDDRRLDPAYEQCAEKDRPVLLHAGTAPMFEDTEFVGIERFRAFRERFPEIRACCAHMGTYQHEAFVETACRDDNVYLDTSFAMSAVAGRYGDFEPGAIEDAVFEDLAGRVMYGSDFPNAPYDYAREFEGLVRRDLSATAFDALFRGAAERFLGET
jgi:predicted TIM-barrel fold metal-dependent hydrolase